MEKPNKKLFSFHINIEQLLPATEEEKIQQDIMRESTSFFKDGLKRLRKNKIAMICLSIIIIITFIAIFVPMFYPYKYAQQLGVLPGQSADASYLNLKPFQYGTTELERIANGEKIFPHLFGTDSSGRDYFIRVVYGTRISLMVGFFASILVLMIGMLYGSISGYSGGKTDLFMMRFVDIIYALPDMLIIILLSVVFKNIRLNLGSALSTLGTNMISIFIVFGMFYWVGMARLIRGQILSVKQQDFVLAARSIGASPARIVRKHLIPNCISVIIISTALQIPAAIFTESFLSFLGLGVSAPMPSLGSLAADALAGIYSYTYRIVIPAVTIWLIVLSFNLLGDGLRDAFDPKLRN